MLYYLSRFYKRRSGAEAHLGERERGSYACRRVGYIDRPTSSSSFGRSRSWRRTYLHAAAFEPPLGSQLSARRRVLRREAACGACIRSSASASIDGSRGRGVINISPRYVQAARLRAACFHAHASTLTPPFDHDIKNYCCKLQAF